MDIVFAIMPLLYLGCRLKEKELKINIKLILCVGFVVWMGTFLMSYLFCDSYLELAGRIYTMYPLCYITAVSGTLFISIGCSMLEGRIPSKVTYIGRNSIYMLCIHMMDYLWRFTWSLSNNEYIAVLIRVVIDIVVFFGFMKCKEYLQKRYTK